MSRTPYMPKDLRGRIFDNRIDRTNDKQPDYTGSANINGQLMHVAAWHNPPDERNRVGNLYLVFEDYHDRKDRIEREKADAANKQGGSPQPQGDFDDDIPF